MTLPPNTTKTIIFILISLAGLYIFRKIGWFVSRNFLYSSSIIIVIIFGIIWGSGIAYVFRLLINKLEPNIVIKIIFGYGVGTYVSIPNYGLLAQSTIPNQAEIKHFLISYLPLLIYIVSCVIFGFII